MAKRRRDVWVARSIDWLMKDDAEQHGWAIQYLQLRNVMIAWPVSAVDNYAVLTGCFEGLPDDPGHRETVRLMRRAWTQRKASRAGGSTELYSVRLSIEAKRSLEALALSERTTMKACIEQILWKYQEVKAEESQAARLSKLAQSLRKKQMKLRRLFRQGALVRKLQRDYEAVLTEALLYQQVFGDLDVALRDKSRLDSEMIRRTVRERVRIKMTDYWQLRL